MSDADVNNDKKQKLHKNTMKKAVKKKQRHII